MGPQILYLQFKAELQEPLLKSRASLGLGDERDFKNKKILAAILDPMLVQRYSSYLCDKLMPNTST